MISGILILLVFAVFALLMYTRVVPALLALPLMAVLMAAVAGVPAAGIAGIVVDGSASLATVYVTVIFGAMLGRVTLDTGIAKSIVNFAAEFAGERPLTIALVLSVVVAVLFVSLGGLGAIIMVGTIVLPIMMTTGVPRKIAATMFLMAFALGFIFNIANWKFYTKFFGVEQQQVVHYAVVLALVDLVALVIYALVAFRAARGYATWAVRSPEPVRGVPWWSLVTPVLPIVLYFGLHVDPLIAFPISAMYGVLTTRPRSAVQTLVASAIRGVEDVAPAVVLFIGIGMLLAATKTPQFLAALHPLVASGALRNPISFVILFGLLSPLALFRGPLNPFGVGIAVFTALLAAHVFPPVILVAAIMAVVQVQNVCDPTNTANVWVANFTGVHLDEITKRT
ncbi:MAG: citrate transporter, partial [Candidatus Eremiobacteraeota bacterium]|nr:citrate transporter [Candidatus Eremiobacteraeota bacterium]